ncbi:hypothetical protein PO909_020095 [Leuciscus waleckii]
MAITPGGGASDLDPVWKSPHRPVCISRDNPLQDVVLSERRRWAFGTGCTVSRVAGRFIVRFSSPTIDSSCAQTGGSGTLQDLTDPPEMAKETLVPTSPTSGTGPSVATTNQNRPSLSSGGTDLAPEPSHVTTLGLAPTEPLSCQLEEAVRKTINNAKAPSTWDNYSSKWRVFSNWCQDKNLDPTNCGLDSILCFLQSLLDSGRKVNTVRVYVAAISHFHSIVEGLLVGKHMLVTQFLKGTRRLYPEKRLRSPSWDLPMVLQSLTKAPFEPLAQADLKSLMWKTVFLLAICSAKRVGELHSLTVSEDCLRWKANYSGVSLWPNPAFLPKVLNTCTINQVIELAAFQPDPDLSCTELDLATLCPVRALRTYVDRTRCFRTSDQLFVCYGGKLKGKALSKQRLSHWIVDAIALAYQQQGRPCPLGVTAHSTRSVASSWALAHGASLTDICRAAGWATPNTFARFYNLRVEPVSSHVLASTSRYQILLRCLCLLAIPLHGRDTCDIFLR